MRKEKIITLDDRGRALTFKVREMPATRLESWIIRALLLVAGTGALDALKGGGAGEALAEAGRALQDKGFQSLQAVDYDKVAPLLDELLGCCYRIDAGIEQQMSADIADGIIEDVKTLFALRKEAWNLNMGFFVDAAPSATDAGQANKSPEQSNPKISVH